MSSEVVIDIRNVSKHYHIYDKPMDRLKQSIYRGTRQYYKEFKALINITFEVKKGETIGIIGRNGSGKSTLLQMICGTLTPTAGAINVNGRVAALLELGAGFNPEFTGRENVYMNASILGLRKEEVDEKFIEIQQFADIGDFIDQPVKTYSSGMYVRLAFAVIAHVDADVLIIDEALSVGDAFFVQKCMRFLRGFMEHGTVLFVSHDTGAIVNLCDEVVWLQNGSIKKAGAPKEVVEQYLESLYVSDSCTSEPLQKSIPASSGSSEGELDDRDMRQDYINSTNLRNDIELFEFSADADAFGNQSAYITNVRLIDQDGKIITWVVGGENVILEIKCKVVHSFSRLIVGFFLKDKLGQILFGDNTLIAYMDNPVSVTKGDEIVAEFEFRMPNLPVGSYSVAASIAEGTQEDHIQHHWIHDALVLISHSSSVCQGLIGVPMKKINLRIVDKVS